MSDEGNSLAGPERPDLNNGEREGHEPRHGRTIRTAAALIVGLVVAAVALAAIGCRNDANRGLDAKVTKLGTVEVTARLIEIPGKFLPNDGLYNYAFVLKYEVLEIHRGQVDRKQIAVGHYNPLKPRPKVGDEFFPDLGGDLKKFRAGDVHRMALHVPLDDHALIGVVDRYHTEDKGPLYWAVWTNLAN